MKRSDSITLVILLLVVMVTAGVTWYLKSNGSEKALVDSAADTSLGTGEGQSPYTTLLGDPVDLDEYRGDILVVNSWASWCPFCVTELPHFADLAAEYEAEGVKILAINRKEQPTIARSYLDSIGGVSNIEILLDPDDRFYASIGGITMPETIFYDRAGNVVLHKRGFMDLKEMRFHLDNVLDKME